MNDHNDSSFSNILLENIDNNIPLSVDVLTPCKKKKSKPKQKTDSSRQKYSKITMNRIKQDLSEEIKRYISSLEKKME